MNAQERKSDAEVKGLAKVMEEPLMTPREVADFLGLPIATLQTWRAKRSGPRGYRVGKHVRYRREDVEAWLEKRADSELLRPA
jgi:excisionase family DNA binding protein